MRLVERMQPPIRAPGDACRPDALFSGCGVAVFLPAADAPRRLEIRWLPRAFARHVSRQDTQTDQAARTHHRPLARTHISHSITPPGTSSTECHLHHTEKHRAAGGERTRILVYIYVARRQATPRSSRLVAARPPYSSNHRRLVGMPRKNSCLYHCSQATAKSVVR